MINNNKGQLYWLQEYTTTYMAVCRRQGKTKERENKKEVLGRRGKRRMLWEMCDEEEVL